MPTQVERHVIAKVFVESPSGFESTDFHRQQYPAQLRCHGERSSTVTLGVRACGHTNDAPQDEQRRSHRKQAHASAKSSTSGNECRRASPLAATSTHIVCGPERLRNG